jgi:hypothetical protein
VWSTDILRGRTVVGEPIEYRSALLKDGRYSLEVPFQDDAWYLAVEEPAHAITLVGPITIALNEKKRLDVVCTEGGGIRGRVKNVPAGWKGHLWVVAFAKNAIQRETRADPDGAFSFSLLPPGEYGLKVGYDDYQDSEVAQGEYHEEVREKKSDPWRRAKVITVEASREASGVELELPR